MNFCFGEIPKDGPYLHAFLQTWLESALLGSRFFTSVRHSSFQEKLVPLLHCHPYQVERGVVLNILDKWKELGRIIWWPSWVLNVILQQHSSGTDWREILWRWPGPGTCGSTWPWLLPSHCAHQDHQAPQACMSPFLAVFLTYVQNPSAHHNLSRIQLKMA